MKRFIFVGIISFLKNSHIVCTTFMQISVILCIARINFKTHISEIFFGKTAGIADIGNAALWFALARQHQNFFNAGIGNNLHFMLNFFHGKLFSVNIVIAVKTAVNTVIFTVICNIQRCENVGRITEVVTRFTLGTLCHFFQKRFCGRGEQCLKVLSAAAVVGKCS